ncbi:MAG: NUDIX domain-containing protein [Candidatus Saccharibacteria bacterium]|nr:NUDIX domain-containing protein [Candidatus Saccharibacteria bacterium]
MISDGHDEMVIVVDDNDNILGYKTRNQLLFTDRTRVSGVWIENGKGDVLLAQRSWQKEFHPGLWGSAAAGGVEKSESYEQNAYKELFEEVGLRDVPLKLVDTRPVTDADGHMMYLAFYKGTVDVEIDQLELEDEVEAVQWMTKKDLTTDIKNNPTKYVPSAYALWDELFLSK